MSEQHQVVLWGLLHLVQCTWFIHYTLDVKVTRLPIVIQFNSKICPWCKIPQSITLGLWDVTEWGTSEGQEQHVLYGKAH